MSIEQPANLFPETGIYSAELGAALANTQECQPLLLRDSSEGDRHCVLLDPVAKMSYRFTIPRTLDAPDERELCSLVEQPVLFTASSIGPDSTTAVRLWRDMNEGYPMLAAAVGSRQSECHEYRVCRDSIVIQVACFRLREYHSESYHVAAYWSQPNSGWIKVQGWADSLEAQLDVLRFTVSVEVVP